MVHAAGPDPHSELIYTSAAVALLSLHSLEDNLFTLFVSRPNVSSTVDFYLNTPPMQEDVLYYFRI